MDFMRFDTIIKALIIPVAILAISGCASRSLNSDMGKVHFIENRKALKWELGDLKGKAYRFVVEGSLLEQRGLIDRAVYNYKRAVDEDDRSPFLRTRLALVLLKQGEIDAATAQINKAISIDENYIDAYSILGKIYLVKADFESAIKSFNKIISVDKKSEDAYLDLCNVYLDRKNYDEAIRILRRLIKVNPSNALAYYYLGRTYSEINRLEKAKEYYKKVIDLKPLFVSAYKAVGLIEEFQGNYPEAVKYFKKALELEIGNDNLRGHIAQIYIEMEDYESAYVELKVLSENNPENVNLKVKMGLVLLKLNRLPEAVVLFTGVLKKHSPSDKVRYYLAGTYFQMQDFENAMQQFSKISNRSDLYQDAQLNIAFMLNKSGKSGKAKQILKNAITNSPKSPELYVTLSTILESEKKFKEAEALIKEALLHNKNNEQLLLRMATILDRQDKKASGLEYVNRVLKQNPDNPNALNYIAYSYAEDGVKLDDALKLVMAALKQKPDDGYILDTLGWIYFKQGRLKLALETLKKANDKVGNEPVILEHLGDVYGKLGNRNRSMEMYNRAIENSTDAGDIERIKNKLRKYADDVRKS